MHEPALGMCRPSTRGIWIDLLCIMHINQQPDVCGTIEELAQICRCKYDEMELAITELDRRNVADINYDENDDNETCSLGHVTLCNKNVRVTSRRMKRECNAREKTRKRVQLNRLRNAKKDVTVPVTPMKQKGVTQVKRPILHISEYIKENSTKENGQFFSKKFGEKFRSHWLAWGEMRTGLRKPKDWKKYLDGVFKKLHQYDEDNACALLELSTINQYQGIIWDRYPTGNQPQQTTTAQQPREESAYQIKQRIEQVQELIKDNRERFFFNFRWTKPEAAEEEIKLKAQLETLKRKLAGV